MTVGSHMRADSSMERLNAHLREIEWHRTAGYATHWWDADHATRAAVRQSRAKESRAGVGCSGEGEMGRAVWEGEWSSACVVVRDREREAVDAESVEHDERAEAKRPCRK